MNDALFTASMLHRQHVAQRDHEIDLRRRQSERPAAVPAMGRRGWMARRRQPILAAEVSPAC